MNKVEQYINDYTNNCSNENACPNYRDGKTFQPWLTPDHARRAVEIAMEEVISWIDDNIWDYIEVNSICYQEMFKSTILHKMIIDMRKKFLKQGISNVVEFLDNVRISQSDELVKTDQTGRGNDTRNS